MTVASRKIERRGAISRVSRIRLREFTQQLSIIGGNCEHNRRKAKKAESDAEPKHSHGKSSFEISRFGFSSGSHDGSCTTWITVPSLCDALENLAGVEVIAVDDSFNR
jgi:hypothetical protein